MVHLHWLNGRLVRGLPSGIGAPVGWLRWLTVAALCDWLIARTLTRSAIFMPKSAAVVAVYQGFTVLGQLAATVASLIAILLLGWIAWSAWLERGQVARPLTLLGLLALGATFLIVPPAGWPAVIYHLLLMAVAIAVAGLGSTGGTIGRWVVRLVPALAILAGNGFHLAHAVYAALRWAGPPPIAMVLFNLGELIAVLSPVALWWVYGRDADPSMWLWAALPALAFVVAHFLNPAMTGIITIWSTGLTLYLPWPIYAGSLWLAGVTVLVSHRRGQRSGPALLLLAAGGYAPQLSTQAWLVLIALWCLTMPDWT